jgi:hypothetical protein
MEKLYNLLFEAGDYTKSYEEFVEQYGDSKKSEPLYRGLNESGDYTKSFEEFKVQYGFNDSVKKKDSSEPIVQEEELVSDTEMVQPPGSSVGSEVIEEQIDFDETLPENQQILLDNQSNIDLLNSVGFFDTNKPKMENIDTMKVLAGESYQIKDPETGEFSLKKESEIPENILKAIKLYEKANPKVVKKEEVILTEEDYNNPDTINQEILMENNVDQEEYLKWEKKNTRQEGSVYKFFKKLLPTDEGNQYQLEKRQYEKLQSYNASKLNTITNKIAANEAAQSLSTNPEEIKALKKEASLLKKEFMNTYSSLESAIDSFPTYKDQAFDDELERRRELYNSFKKGGGAELSAGGIELLKTGGTALTSFATDFVGGIPGMIDQRLATFGYDKKGFLAGVSEMITDSGDRADLELGELKRPAFLEGKPVTFEGEEFIVDGNGTVYDSNSNIRMEGILSEEKINSIIKRSKDVPNTVINWTGGSVATGGVNTIVNLVALIRTAGKVKNATGLNKVLKPNTAGKVSMGLTSFTSGVVKNVDDIRSQLMATGMSEKEAMDIAVNAGQAISTLDGIFSGLAGSNEGLLVGFQAIKDQVKNLAIKEGKKFTKKQLVDKGLALGKENMKELFVEELPVYFSEKGINYLVNQKIGNEVLDQKITAAGVIETGVMTIGATSTLGGRKLLTGNKRKDLVRTLATDVKDLKKTLDVLIDEGSLSKEEAANAYSEIYNMQAAELKTKGTIKMSQNVEEAADLLEQRQRLIDQKEGLEGPLKEEIDKRIEDVDAQIKKLQERDVAEAQSIIDGEKDGQRTVEVTKEEAVKALQAENEVRLKSKLPAILESEANILKKQNELIKDKQDAIQESTINEEITVAETGKTEKVDGFDKAPVYKTGGKPVLFHGSAKKFTEFDIEKIGSGADGGTARGIFFTSDPEVASFFSKETGSTKGNVIRLVKSLTGKSESTIYSGTLNTDNIKTIDFKGQRTSPGFDKNKTIQEAFDQGFDAVILKNIVDGPNKAQDVTVVKDMSVIEGFKDTQSSGNKLIKKYKQNAIQESSTKGVDVQKQTGDGQKVVKGDTTRAVANQSQKETEGQTKNQKTEVESAKKNLQQIKKAKSVVKRIKRLIKNSNAPAEVVNSAKEFIKLKPENINDLDLFVNNANSVVQGLTPIKTSKKGDIKISEALDIKSIDKYTKAEQAVQDKIKNEADQKAFADLTGLDPKDFSLDELQRILYNFETNNLSAEEKTKLRQTKKSVIAKGLKNAFGKYSAVVDKIVKTGKDPFTGKEIKISQKDKKIVSEFLNIDISNLPSEDAAKALLAMNNFATNQSAGGLNAIVNFAKGRQNAVDNQNKLNAKPLKFLIGGKMLGNAWNKFIASIPQSIEQMFKSQSKALLFEKISGFTTIRNGVAKADKLAQNITEAYYDKFINPGGLRSKVKLGNTKTMPNGKRFNDVENDLERGVFAFMKRTVDGTEAEQDQEFKRRKGLVELSIKELKDNGQTEKAENYQKVFDKLLKNSNSINEVDKKTDPINKSAVEWMTNEWSKARPELEDVSLNIYNRTLGKDLNYTPDSFSKLDGVESEPSLDKPIFQPDTNETVYDKETGVLKVKKPSFVLPMDKDGNTNRYVNLGFDSNNVNNLRAALTDVNTAPGIQQLKGFMSSPSFEKIIPNTEDRKLIKERFKGYVEKKRGLQKGQEKWLRNLNRFAGLGVSRVLGGPTQYVKQMVPLINTFINTINNPSAAFKGVNLIATNTDAIKWLDNSGVEIANRGVQAVTNLEGTDSRLETDSTGKAGKFGDVINKAQKSWLQGFLVNPDRFAARASFMAYYLESLKKQNIDSNNIDWSTHKSNDKALNYATQQVARQQNTSDVDLQGELFSSKDPVSQVFRKVAFPFANFLLNQKTRMYNDLGAVFSKSNTVQDKLKAGKSLGGLIAETATFNAVGLFITQSLAGAARALRGTDEDEETLLKQFENRKKGRKGQAFADVVSPIPLLNPEVLQATNALIATFDSDDPFQFFVNQPEGLLDRLGVLGIGGEKALQIYDMVSLATTGKYKDRYGREVEIDPKYKNDLLAQAPLYVLYLLGALPLEAGSIMDYNFRAYKKTRKAKGNSYIPKKKTKKKTKKSTKPSGPTSPFSNRRNSGMPKSPF